MLKLCNISKLETVSEKPNSSVSFLVGINEYFIPIENNINVEEELTKLNAELEYNKGFLKSVLVKLSNEKFVSGAPAKVIEIERKKQADAESKIKSLEEQIASLKN